MDLSKIVKEYAENGFVVVKNAIPNGDIEKLVKEYFFILEQNDSLKEDEISSHVLQSSSVWRQFIGRKDILDIVEVFLGKNIAHFYSRFFVKKPIEGREVPWHQDGAYYELSHNNMVTVWVALDNSDKKNGCLKVVPGTHLVDYLELEPVDNDPYLKRKIKTLPFDTSQGIALELAAGDISLHHPNILHGSDANLSDNWRRGFVIKYIAGDVDILCEQKWPWAMLVRGKCESEITSEQLVSSF